MKKIKKHLVSTEEDTEKYIETSFYMNKDRMADIIFGVKWQQERSYSEEEVFFFIREALYDTNMRYDRISAEEWFEQFKKK